MKSMDMTVITSGSTYLDIDAYACCVAMAELLRLKGENAIAYSSAARNYSVCPSLVTEDRMATSFPSGGSPSEAEYIIVDVSDPKYLSDSIPLERVVAVYDHHVGFEDYWEDRIGDGAHIEFIGAAATLIYREWKKAGLADKMLSSTAKLLIAAILDNTLNLSSPVTTREDIDTFNELCKRENLGKEWRASYFSEVQESVEAELENALLGDVKHIRDNPVLPPYMGQIAVWNTKSILRKLAEIRKCFDARYGCWMLNIIDIQQSCNYFLCDSIEHQKKIEAVFDVRFEAGLAKTARSYLRKEILKKTVF